MTKKEVKWLEDYNKLPRPKNKKEQYLQVIDQYYHVFPLLYKNIVFKNLHGNSKIKYCFLYIKQRDVILLRVY